MAALGDERLCSHQELSNKLFVEDSGLPVWRSNNPVPNTDSSVFKPNNPVSTTKVPVTNPNNSVEERNDSVADPNVSVEVTNAEVRAVGDRERLLKRWKQRLIDVVEDARHS